MKEKNKQYFLFTVMSCSKSSLCNQIKGSARQPKPDFKGCLTALHQGTHGVEVGKC